MTRLNRDQQSAFFFFAVGIGIYLIASQYEIGTFASPGPGFLGLCLGIVISFLSGIGFFLNLRKPMHKQNDLFGPYWGNSFALFISFLGYALLLNFLGFLICTFLFIFILFRRAGAHDWKSSLAWSLGTTSVAYMLFQLWLEVQLPMGILKDIGF